MARNDVYLNINSLSPADAVVTGQQDMTAATIPELVLGDTPTFNFYFTDNTNVWPSWAGNAAYTLTWALSDAVAGDFAPAATTGNATPITGGWSVVLPLNSYDLVGLLNTKRVGQPYPVQNLWQQLRVTDPSGNEITRAMVWTPVRYRAISDTQNTESASPTGGRFVTVNNVNELTTPTDAQFYAANPVPTSALGTASNGELFIGNGTGFTKATLTAGTGVAITNGSGSITIDATNAQELLTATVTNAEATQITKGQVVYIFGATGNRPSVKLAYNTGDATSAKTFGVVSDASIAAGGTGTVTCVGVVDGLNLGTYSDGDTVYLGATPGSITATKPYAPNHLVYVGIIERANAGNGELYVRIQNGYELDEIHDVQITAPKLAGQTLIYDQTNDLWKNARLTGTANQITVTNADAAVTLSIPTNPTLNGNLTVSGSGTVNSPSGTSSGLLVKAFNAASGSVQQWADFQTSAGLTLARFLRGNGASGYDGNGLNIDSFAGFQVSMNALGGSGGDFTIKGGNLTVSGTGNSSVAGTFLVATTTNSSNGRIQLATHTTSAGGIGFGTDTSLYRIASSRLSLDGQFYLNSANPILFLNESDQSADSRLWGFQSEASVLKFRAFNDAISSATDVLTFTRAGDATFAGTVTVASSTPSLTLSGTSGKLLLTDTGVGSTSRNWAIGYSQAAEGDFVIRVSNAVGGDPIAGTTALGFDRTGAATFSGAVAIGNTVNTVSPTSPNRTITMVIGGTTYYIHAKTTND